MFCYQCEQTAGGKSCVRTGVCGKDPVLADKQDELTSRLVGLARAVEGKSTSPRTDDLVMEALFATLTNVNFDPARIDDLNETVIQEKEKYGGAPDLPAETLWSGDPDLVSLRSTFLFGLRGLAAYAWHARVLGKKDPAVTSWLYRALRALGEDHPAEEWLDLLMELGRVNLTCLQHLDEAHTTTFGHPQPAKVTTTVVKGPFIVVSGHDLYDLKELLVQTEGRGINIYTHGEMLPAHGYPELKKHAHLKGHFGTAWQNQQKEFADLPAPILFTTNCLMPPKESYMDRVFTTGPVGYPGALHIPAGPDGKKDFTPLIEKALALGGWPEDRAFTGRNGGSTLVTGFARQAVLGAAEKIIAAVKKGAIRHFFLVGGCDGPGAGRNYYAEFVKKAPPETIILTLACGKFRFNDLDLGEIDGLPRLMDMGQCNDAYSAVRVALALAEAFGRTVNELPLTLVLSWYEQKAVAILLSLLALGIKNIRLGPRLPAFISPNVLQILTEKFNLHPLRTPEEDLQAILG